MTVQQPPPTKHELLGTMGEIILTVDEHAREINRRWGFNRLPHIVPIEWTERFQAQKFKWERALFECTGSPMPEHLARVRQHGEAMLRAFDKLEDVAMAAGKSPAPAATWEFETRDGKPIVLVRTRAEMSQVQRDPPAQVWCLEEIGEIITKFPELLAVKDAFPEAEVVRMQTDPLVIGELNDALSDIPW